MLLSLFVKRCVLSACQSLSVTQIRSIKTMEAWQISHYGGIEALQLNSEAQIPIVKSPTDILVKVHSSSINPLDLRMLEGYGATSFKFMHQVTKCTVEPKEFPLIPGRDFSGTVVHLGKSVKNLKVGDEVWGALAPWQSGSHAQYVLGSMFNTCKKPNSLNHSDSASFPYAALTAWSSLCYFGELSEKSTYGKRILIIGASGGVGTIAVQLLKSWGADVTVVCSTDAVQMLLDLGADTALDYRSPEFKRNLQELKGLDIVFDNIGKDYPDLTTDLLKSWKYSKYITPVSPLLKNVDEKGLLFGIFISSLQAAFDSVMTLKDGRSFRWSYFVPDARGLKSLAKLIDDQQIRSVVEEIYSFEDLKKAYERVGKGHLRGKIVVNHLKSEETK